MRQSRCLQVRTAKDFLRPAEAAALLAHGLPLLHLAAAALATNVTPANASAAGTAMAMEAEMAGSIQESPCSGEDDGDGEEGPDAVVVAELRAVLRRWLAARAAAFEEALARLETKIDQCVPFFDTQVCSCFASVGILVPSELIRACHHGSAPTQLGQLAVPAGPVPFYRPHSSHAAGQRAADHQSAWCRERVAAEEALLRRRRVADVSHRQLLTLSCPALRWRLRRAAPDGGRGAGPALLTAAVTGASLRRCLNTNRCAAARYLAALLTLSCCCCRHNRRACIVAALCWGSVLCGCASTAVHDKAVARLTPICHRALQDRQCQGRDCRPACYRRQRQQRWCSA